MPGFAKFMAFMNVVAAAGFLALATMDWNARRPWSYEMFRSELAEHGLPLDEHDPAWRIDIALAQDLDGSTIKDMLKNAGGNPVKPNGKVIHNQIEELDRVRDEILDELSKIKDEDEKRDRLKQYILPLTQTLEEREYWADRLSRSADTTKEEVPVDQLVKEFISEFFERAKLETNVPIEKSDYLVQDHTVAPQHKREDFKPEHHDLLTRRQKVAHLLYNLTEALPSLSHQRVLAIIGLRAFINEAELQAARLRDMTARTRVTMIEERTAFEVQYMRLINRILAMHEEIESKKYFYEGKKDILERAQNLAKIRLKDRDDIKADLDKAVIDTTTALKSQSDLENELFEIQKQLGEVKNRAEQIEKYVTRMEGVRRAGQ